jgi:transglutaminase-like putative cysteine protease
VLVDDERFYGDIVVDASTTSHVRLPTVGPGTKLVHARLGIGSRDVPFRIVRDGADNWFLDASESVRARLVVDLAIPRATFGGEFGDPRWEDLPSAPAVPPNVAHAALAVESKIGVSRSDRPHAVVKKLVAYFRAFADSDEPPAPEHDIYTDLALSQKGVCRHRSYAFMITALSMGIPTRLVTNEAHAWVEVHDGTLWKRIDLGGAGRLLNTDMSRAAEPYSPPADPFAWPPNAASGDDMSAASRAPGNRPKPGPSPSGTSKPPPPSSTSSSSQQDTQRKDERASTVLTLEVVEPSALRGTAVHVKGTASSDGDPCPHLPVEILLRDGATGREARVGGMATDENGSFSGALVLPQTVSLGDYYVVAKTGGDARCGSGAVR